MSFMKELHMMYYSHLKNEEWDCPQKSLVMKLSHQSSSLSCTQLFGLLDSSFMIQQRSLSKAMVFSLYQDLVLILVPQLILKCATNSFSFPFLYKYMTSTCLLLNCLIFTFKDVLLWTVTYFLPFSVQVVPYSTVPHY